MINLFKKIYLIFLRINSLRSIISFVKAFVYLQVLRKKPKIFNGDDKNISDKTVASNMRIIHEDGTLPEHPTSKFLFNIGLNQGNPKSDMLIEPVNAVLSSRISAKIDAEVLSIGPRSLGEVLNIQSHGYQYKKIKAVDLFSISSKIDVGDIHNLPYADNSFDVVFCGWVIAYSENKKLAASEITRVLKPGGIFSIGVSYSPKTNEEQILQRGYLVGSEDRLESTAQILELFEDNVGRIYFETNPEDLGKHSQIICTGSVK
jgi:SAM-dependent methyltransferase